MIVGDGFVQLGVVRLMLRPRPIIACMALSLAQLSGCQQAELDAVTEADAAPTQPAIEPEPVAQVEVAAAERQELRQAMADYLAPYPNRVDMFVPPKDGPTSGSSYLAEGDVQLRGFVDLGEPKVILDIEGATALVAVGGEKYGVKVVSIENQKVVLQRGPTRWTASLD